MLKAAIACALFFRCFSCLPTRTDQQNTGISEGRLLTDSKISVRGHHFVDDFGRVRIFHGWNSVLKKFPWYDAQILNETRLDYLKEWGLNTVRLGTMWAGTEPSEGRYNETYVGLLKTAVAKLGRRGIYAILDMHQDVISSKFDEYDGVPRWLIDDYCPPERHEYPWPLPRMPSKSNWFLGYLSEPVGQAFQCIYDNAGSSADKMARFWRKIASEFKDVRTVLGYELINEPWAGDIYEDPSLLIPGRAGRVNLQPLYQRLNGAIREIDSKTIIFYEPVMWAVYLGNNESYLGTGFTQVPGGPKFNDRSALSYHYYCLLLSSDMSLPYPYLERVACTILSENVFDDVVNDVKKTGGGLFLTEFGLCAPDGSPDSGNTLECERVLDEADSALQSWTYWDSEFFHPNGSIDETVAKAFSRTYARAIAGQPISMSFNYTTAEFRFKYTLDRSLQAPTEIFVSPWHYPKGKTVTVTGGVVWREDLVQHLIFIEPAKSRNRRTNENESLHWYSESPIVDVSIVAL